MFKIKSKIKQLHFLKIVQLMYLECIPNYVTVTVHINVQPLSFTVE